MSDIPEIEVDHRDRVVVVRLHIRDLDERHMRQLMSDMAAAVAITGSAPFILDFSDVKFLPSLALGTLVRLSGDFRTRKQRLIVVGLQPQIQQVIRLTHLELLFEIQPDVETALKQLPG